ncbi:MAG: patatin-like phospholipase family protein [Bacteroidales bacterium]
MIILILTLPLKAQKVGLVLSGGGSKGISHIGVIKALEEQGIPISYITGTSMGAIIGGLYASGYSPEDMIDIINSEEFPNWVTGEIEEKYLYHFKRKNSDANWFSLNFNYDSLVLPSVIPANIISPILMDYALMELFAGAAAVAHYNFDSLFIPFRCIASDIAENKALVLKKGDLGSAVRASMTFPFYFKPIRIEGKLLFDGGMYNNFPTDIMMNDFSPEIILGSKAVSNYPPPQDNNLISQLQSMLMVKTDYSFPNDKNVLISMDLPEVGLVNFSNSIAFIDSGYVATMRRIKEIKSLIRDSISKEEINHRREKFKQKTPEIIIDSLVVMKLKKSQDYYLKKILFQDNKSFRLDQLKPQYFKVIADDKIETMYPTLQYDRTKGAYRLLLKVEKEKNTRILVGGNVSSKPVNNAFFGVEYKYLGKQAATLTANTYIGRFYSSGFVGARVDFPSRRPYYLEGHVSFNQWDYFKTKTYFFEDKTPSYLIKNDNHIEADIGFPFGNKGKLMMGYTLAHLRNDFYQSNYFTREDTADKSFYDFGSPHLLFEINTLNRKEYANSGLQLSVELRYNTGHERFEPGSTSNLIVNQPYKKAKNYIQYRLTYQNYFKHIKPFTLGWYFEMMLSNQPFFQNYTATLLMSPSFEVIPESKTIYSPVFKANSFAASGIQTIVNIYQNIDLRLEGYLFQPYREYLEMFNQKTEFGKPFAKRYITGSMVLVWHTAIAPVSLSLNYFEKQEQPFSVIFNIGYLIFNKKAIN